METNNFLVKARTSVAKITPELSRQLRKEARMAQWPRSVADKLVIKAKGDQLVVEYPRALESQINELEYGTEDKPGTPVIRRFMRQHKKLVENQLVEASLEFLEEQEAI